VAIRAAVDIGGSFTDIVCVDETNSVIKSAKVPSTPRDPASGVISAIEICGLNLEKCSYLIHGTTVGLNCFLQRKGSKTGLVTTFGFKDILEIARMARTNMYDFWYKRPKPLVPRPYRLEVRERVSADGRILRPLSRNDVTKAADYFNSQAIEAVAVCFLHSYANPKHEKEAGAILRSKLPKLKISLSHEVAREHKEYERTSTTVLDAYIKHQMTLYVDRLNDELKGRGFKGKLMITLSSGGARDALLLARTPIMAFNSGPAGGVVGASNLSRILDIKNLIAIDAGGTSFDVSIVTGSQAIVTEYSIVESYPILMPAIDIKSIGAGGGSIAWVDEVGHLHLGPQSAGADPGPMCYGKGGREPTVTDAAAYIGILDPDYFLGGSIKLNPSLAYSGIKRISKQLGLTPEDAAASIIMLTIANMAAAVREVTVARGKDPRNFALLSYGGATSMLVADLAHELGIHTVVIPREPGNFSAWGMLFNDIIYDYSRTFIDDFDDSKSRTYERIFKGLQQMGARALREERVPRSNQRFLRSIDLRYEWQAHHLSVPLPSHRRLGATIMRATRQSFQRLYEENFGHSRDSKVQSVNLRLRAQGIMPKPKIKKMERGNTHDSRSALIGARKIWQRGSGFTNFSIYDRNKLKAGQKLVGPAVVEEATSTTLVRASDWLEVDAYGNLVLNVSV
jgi:N-methylhydantoinase A